MAQTGYTPILIYGSGTTTNVPLAANLTSNSNGAELAINYADGKLFYKDSGGVVQVLATKGAGTIGGSNTQIQYNSSGSLAGSANLTYDGTTFTSGAPTVISMSSSSDALRITQTGAGNALLVEDSANPDSTPFVIDASGNIASGLTSPTVALEIYRTSAATFRIDGDGVSSTIQARSFSDTAGTAPILNYARARGTKAASTIVQSGDLLAQYRGAGWDGASFIQGANIEIYVDGTPGTNDMPGRLVFSTTADGASSPTERMRINNAGSVGIGATSFTANLDIAKTITGGTSWYGIRQNSAIQSDVTTGVQYNRVVTNTAASAFTVTNVTGYQYVQGTIGSTSAITNQYGFAVDASPTGATNNYGFYGDIASGTGRYNLYMNGTADNYMAGKTGIGGTASVGQILRVGGSLTGATSSRQVIANGVVASDVTARADSYYSVPQTAASSFTLGILSHFHAVQSTIGAGSTVTTQIGFEAESSLIGATSNYGFYGNIASGTGRYNFYANGTADNYFAGNVGIAKTPAVALDVSGTLRSTSTTITGAAGGTITPTSDTTNQYTITALGAAATIAIPSGTPIDGQKLTIRIKDNGTARALTWTTSAGGYRIIGTTLPTTTVISKTVYVGCAYNSADSFWDVVAVAQQA